MCNVLNLFDIYQKLHPKTRSFTYESKTINLKSRIDFILVSLPISIEVQNAEIRLSVAPDHKATFLKINVRSEQVIPQYCIAQLYCARFSRHQRAHISACSCKTWRICLDFDLCQLKNGYSAPTSMGTATFFLWGKTNLISIAENWINNENRK